jgi:hypothetical protein
MLRQKSDVALKSLSNPEFAKSILYRGISAHRSKFLPGAFQPGETEKFAIAKADKEVWTVG